MVIEVTLGPVRSISSVPADGLEKFPAGSSTTTLYRPPALGVVIVPLLPAVCFVMFVFNVRELTEDGSTRYALRSALDIVDGTSHTWSVDAMPVVV